MMTTQALKNWQKFKLGDLARDVRELYTPTKEEKLPYVGLEHIEQQTLHLSGIGRSDETESTKKIFKSGDILFGTLRPYFRKVTMPNFDGVCSTDIAVIRPTEKSDGDFLKYFIANKEFIDHASNISSGTRMPRANWKVLKEQIWLFPGFNEQKEIGGFLVAYDDLIENNTRRIKILEQMAQAIYTEWFVNFRFPGHDKAEMIESGTDFGKIPDGWVVRKMGEVINVARGKNITRDTVTEGTVPVVAGGLEPAYFHKTSNTTAPVVTISASGANAGYVNLYMEDVWASDCSFIDKKTSLHVLYYFLLLKSRQVEVTGLQRGSAQPHVYPKDLAGLLVVNPPDHILKRFEEAISPIFSLLGNLRQRNKVLRDSRDLLLPKLVTGEIRV